MTESAPASHRHLGRVARGGAIGLVGAVVSSFSGFALVVILTRGFTPEEAGRFFAVTSVFLVLAAASVLGADTGLARFLMRYEAQGHHLDVRRVLRAAAIPVAVAALVSALLLLVGAASLSRLLGLGEFGTRLLQVLAITLPFAVAADLALSVTRAFSRMRTTVFVDRFLRAGIQPIAALVVVVIGGGILLVTLTWGLAYLVSALIAVTAARRFLVARLPAAASAGRVDGGRREVSVRREFWEFTWARGLARLAQISIQKADIVIVAALLSPAHAAVYTAATRFVSLGQFATQAIQQVLQPRFTAILLHEDTATLREVYRVATAWSIALAWPLYLVVGCAPLVYLSIFGDDYTSDLASGPAVVMVMAAAMLLAVASGPVDTLLLMSGRSRASLMNAVLALVVDLALCLLLVPALGITGAALAWAAAVLTRCGLAFVQVRRHLGVTPGGGAVLCAGLLPVLCIAVPVTTYSLAGPGSLPGFAGVLALCALAYGTALFVLRKSLRLDVLTAALWRRRESTRGKGSSMRARRMVSWLRRRLPAPAIQVARLLALQWGRLTARWRMTPAVVIAGAQRSGTTTLFRLLEAHPNLVRPTLSKGTGYFDDNYHRGPRWYLAHFPLRRPSWLRRGRGDRLATFECSGYYMFHPLAPGRIAHDLPDARVVVMVRDPVERAYSAHRHELARGYETLPFEEAVVLESDRLDGEESRLREEPGYTSFSHRHHGYLARSEYAAQVGRLIDALGHDRVYVLDADEFFADPAREFIKLQEWLGLSVWVPPVVARWNAQPREPLTADQRDTLRHHFASHDAELARLIGRAPAWRQKENIQ